MKLKISYLQEEETEAKALARIIKLHLKRVRVKERAEHLPYKQIYISTEPPHKGNL